MSKNLLESGHSPELAKRPLQRVIESYTEYYAAGSGRTALAKRRDLQLFIEFLCHHTGKRDPRDLTIRDWNHSAVQRFVDQGLEEGQAPATISRRLATLRHMGRTLAEKVSGFINPAKEVRAPKLQQIRPKALTQREIEEIHLLIDRMVNQKPSFNRIRNKAIFTTLLETGLRADEVRTLKLSQIDERFEWIRDVKTKGRRFRNVYINSYLRQILTDYLRSREIELKRILGSDQAAKKISLALPLFLSAYRAKPAEPASFLMDAKSVWRAVRSFSADIKLHPHLLRHSFATDLLNSSGDIRLVAQALGHSDVRITMRYTERGDEQVAAAVESSRAKRHSSKRPKS